MGPLTQPVLAPRGKPSRWQHRPPQEMLRIRRWTFISGAAPNSFRWASWITAPRAPAPARGKAAPALAPSPARGTAGGRRRPMPAVSIGCCQGRAGTHKPGHAVPGAGAGAAGRNALPTPAGGPRRDKTRLLSGECCRSLAGPIPRGAAGQGTNPGGIGVGVGCRVGGTGARPGPWAGWVSHGRGWHGAPGRPLPAGTAFSGRACLGSSGDAGLAGTAQPRRARGPRRPNTTLGQHFPPQTPARLRHRPRHSSSTHPAANPAQPQRRLQRYQP